MRKEIRLAELTVNETILIAKAQTRAYAIAPFIILVGIAFHFFPILEKGDWFRNNAFILSLIIVVIQIFMMNWKYYFDQRMKIKYVFESRVDKKWTQEKENQKRRFVRFNNRTVEITEEAFGLINQGDLVEIHMAPKSKLLLDIEIIQQKE